MRRLKLLVIESSDIVTVTHDKFEVAILPQPCHRSMVYIQSWQDYQEAAEALYSKSPNEVSHSLDGLFHI